MLGAGTDGRLGAEGELGIGSGPSETPSMLPIASPKPFTVSFNTGPTKGNCATVSPASLRTGLTTPPTVCNKPPGLTPVDPIGKFPATPVTVFNASPTTGKPPVKPLTAPNASPTTGKFPVKPVTVFNAPPTAGTPPVEPPRELNAFPTMGKPAVKPLSGANKFSRRGLAYTFAENASTKMQTLKFKSNYLPV